MRTSRFVTLSVALALALTAGVASAADDSDTSAAIRKTLQSRYPDITIVDVQASPLKGIYEVFTGDSIAYSDATGEFLMLGSLVNTRTGANLTSVRIDERNAVDFASLPLPQAIKVVKGNGKRQLAVFSDPDCPFCQELEKTLVNVTDVTMYVFLYPIAKLHPDAPKKAHAIWCADNRSEAWTHWMTEKREAPEATAACKEDPLDEVQALGKKLRVNGTPTLIFANGRRASGALEVAPLEAALNASATAR